MNRLLRLVAMLGVGVLLCAAAYPQTDADAAIQRVRAREAAARARITQYQADLASAQSILTRARQLQGASARQAEQVALRAIAKNRRAIRLEQANVKRYVNAIRALEQAKAARRAEGAFGEGAAPALLRGQGGITEAEWQQAREYQRGIDELKAKGFLSREEMARLDELEARRNALWKRAISVPGLTAEDRERLRLKLYTGSLTSPVMSMTPEQSSSWAQPPADAEQAAQALSPVDQTLAKETFGWLEDTASEPAKELATELLLNEEQAEWLGDAVVAYEFVQADTAGRIAQGLDWGIGKVPLPGIAIAREGGEIVTAAVKDAWITALVGMQQVVEPGYTPAQARAWTQQALTEGASTGQLVVLEFLDMREW